MNKFYIVRWYNSDIYTSVNTIEYVLDIVKTSRPTFYKFLVYELIETKLNFKDLTLKLPFDKNLNHISSLRLHNLEKQKLKYHFKKLKEYYINQPNSLS